MLLVLCCAMLCFAGTSELLEPSHHSLAQPVQPQPVTSQPVTSQPPLSLARSLLPSLPPVVSSALIPSSWFSHGCSPPSLPTQKISAPQLPGHSPLRISPPSLPSAPLSLLRLLPSLLFPSSPNSPPSPARLIHNQLATLRPSHHDRFKIFKRPFRAFISQPIPINSAFP